MFCNNLLDLLKIKKNKYILNAALCGILFFNIKEIVGNKEVSNKLKKTNPYE